jgi:hypothetical protein
MKGYKSPVRRLAQFFKKSRDKWKKRAKEKQKELRRMKVKVRDLSKSREQWKKKAKEAERKLGQIEKEQQAERGEGQKKETTKAIEGTLIPAKSEEKSWTRPTGHHYPIFVMQLGIQQIVHSLNSLRGSQKNFELFAQFLAVPTPSYSSIRRWLFRLGLYKLQQEAEYGTDWIIILDLTVELGQLKCLVILGIPAARLSETGYALAHQDVEVLDIVVLTHSTGEVIKQKLFELSAQIGPPLQIVSDHGSDVKKGVELYKQENSEVVWTYDITHQMALLLKKELKNDAKYQSFVRQCSLTRQQVKQTELYFLVPPKQRLKARYLNVDSYVYWAQQVLAYQQQDDFSQISSAFTLNQKTVALLADKLDDKAVTQLSAMKGKTYPDEKTFTQTLIKHIGPELFEQKGKVICQAADVGRSRFQEKLGWLIEYKADIALYAQLVELVLTVEKQVKQDGLHRASKATFAQKMKQMTLLPARVQQFKAQVLEYLDREGAKIPEGQTLLATSDIIESIFGKYKLFAAERSLKEMGKMVLTIPVFTAKITADLVQKAMESVREIDVERWSNRVFGQSMLSKRRSVFSQQRPTQKLYEKPP